MYGMNYTECGGAPLTMADILPSVGWQSDSDQIQVAYTDAGGNIQFESYFYFDYDPNWINFTDPEGWYDAAGDKVNIDLPACLGFWISTGMNQAITVAGEVIPSATVPYALTGGNFEMLANAWPIKLDPNTDFSVTVGQFTSDADQIQVAYADAGGNIQFNSYFFFDYDPNWINFTDPEGWYDAAGDKVAGAIIQPNQGFWLFAANPVTFEIATPVVQ